MFGVGAVEEAAVIERTLLAGFIRDRLLLGKALEAGFRPDLMPHTLGRTLAKTLTDIYEQKDAPLEPVTVRGLLGERGTLSPEMKRFVDAVEATQEPDAARVMAYVDLLKARSARLRLVEVGDAITHHIGQERGAVQGPRAVLFLGTDQPGAVRAPAGQGGAGQPCHVALRRVEVTTDPGTGEGRVGEDG